MIYGPYRSFQGITFSKIRIHVISCSRIIRSLKCEASVTDLMPMHNILRSLSSVDVTGEMNV